MVMTCKNEQNESAITCKTVAEEDSKKNEKKHLQQNMQKSHRLGRAYLSI